jgi:AraC-like DNA-binding protein
MVQDARPRPAAAVKVDKVTRAKAHYATAKVRNIAAIPATLGEFGADADAVLRRAGVDLHVFSDPENVVPYAALGRLVTECVKATGCERFGLRVGANTKAGALGLTSLVSFNAPTVRAALEVIIDTLKTSETGGTAFLDIRDGLASFGYAVVAPDIEGVDQIEDGSVAIAFNIMRQLCGAPWRPIRVRLARKPPRDKAPFTRFFAAPVDFAEPRSCLVFDAAVLDAPVRDSNPDYANILAPLLEEALANARGDFLSSVKAVIRSQLVAGALSRDRVCRALGLNGRTLAHRLEAFDVTYSGLADEAKFEAAQSLLMKDKTIAQIALALDFAETSAFSRAFKAWSGTTPARWRAERGGGR